MFLGDDRHFSALRARQMPALVQVPLSLRPMTQGLTVFSLSQGLTNFFCEEPGGKYLGL